MTSPNETILSAASGHSVSAEIPSNLYTPKAPFTARLVENTRLTDPDSPNDVRHLVFNLEGSNLWYVEGQSLGVLPPGEDATGKPHKLRLYSIASPQIGDDGQGKTVTLCVKRAITHDPETGAVYKGVCSSYLCDLSVGDTTLVTGPVGKAFLMPPDPQANIVMVATGTGIAPFRAFLHKRYAQKTALDPQTWLFFGAQTQKDFLYHSELKVYQQHPGFHLVTAFSREEQNAAGGRMYVQDRLTQHAEALIELLQQPNTYFYICGLKGMETGILEGLNQAATKVGLVWDDLFAQLKAEKRWHVEVY